MVVSNELVYAITRGKNAFFRRNLNGYTFTSDPFSGDNRTQASKVGFYTRGAKGVAAVADDSKQKLTVTTYSSKHKLIKKGKKKNRKSLVLKFATKDIDAKKRAPRGDALAGKKAYKLKVIQARIGKQAKKTK